jgi:hypothetical protein
MIVTEEMIQSTDDKLEEFRDIVYDELNDIKEKQDEAIKEIKELK